MTDQPSLPRWRATQQFVGKHNVLYGPGVIVESASRPAAHFVAVDAADCEVASVSMPKPAITEGEAPPFAGLYRIGTNADGTAKWSTRPAFPDVVAAIQDAVLPRYRYAALGTRCGTGTNAIRSRTEAAT
jgi:hypothetical protein